MTFKCIHIADVHFRGLKRHDEYKKVFIKFLYKAKELKPDLIYIGGDIVHSKTQNISPELIDVLTWWFTEMSLISPVHVILGNHDGLILNENRQDAISPIIKALNNDNIFLYKKSGVYPTGIKGFNWCVFSCFDEKGWDNVKPINEEVNIACYHGPVEGSLTDVDWSLEGEIDLKFFNGYDFGFLGDIHRFQYLDTEKRVAYPGSTIQQNYGEEIKKGFLFWEINTKNDYKSTFYELENDTPFLTIDWENNVEDTIEKIRNLPKKSRIRIKSDKNITQAEIVKFHETTKKLIKPSEIVYKIEEKSNKELDFKTNIENLFDINDKNSRLDFLKDYLGEDNKEYIDQVNDLFDENLQKLEEENTVNANKWSINNIKFNNTFSYGKDNYINFKNLSGITGIFGKNRCGKSSIPGTIMYGLFNATDRGPIKNLHVINTRKGDCSVSIDLNVNNDRYIVERESKKNQNKKGIISASTKLNLKKIDENGDELNETEEQRRETEKVLRNLIGTSEDFLYTAFASQGEINTFIKEKNTARKTVLSKFLNLDIYENLWKVSREEYTYLKANLKTNSDKDWAKIISDAKEEVKNNNFESQEINNKINALREEQISVSISLEKLKMNIKRHPSGFNISEIKKKIKDTENKFINTNKVINDKKEDLSKLKQKIEKIKVFKENFPIDNLKSDKEKLDILSAKFDKVSNSLKFSKNNKKQIDNRIKILDNVPCGDAYPKCMFIKDAYEDKSKIKDLNDEISYLEGTFLEIKELVNNLKKENIDEKIKKYNSVLNTEYKTNLDIESLEKNITLLEKNNQSNNENLEKYTVILNELNILEDEDNIDKEIELNSNLDKINKDINDLEIEKNIINKKNATHLANIDIWLEERKNFNNLINKWKIYDLFTYCVSKKGIPTKLIDYALPKINKEIKNILQGVTGFNVEILAENSNKNLEVYIDYGDSKRIIECASGMEKMMASLAIRVALINISSLPKSDLFIIDEGFGALDDSNVEACGMFLQSLKKWFKSILIISHVDAVKDMVDNILEINVKGKDSHVIFR